MGAKWKNSTLTSITFIALAINGLTFTSLISGRTLDLFLILLSTFSQIWIILFIYANLSDKLAFSLE